MVAPDMSVQPEFPYRMLAHGFVVRAFESTLHFLELFAGYMGLTNLPFRNPVPVLKAR